MEKQRPPAKKDYKSMVHLKRDREKDKMIKCEIHSTARYNNKLLKECAREGRQVCRDDLFGALIDFLKDGYKFPPKNEFGCAAEAKDFMKDELSNQCRARVEELLFD